MVAAAAAWDVLAAELSTAATGYGSILSELTSEGWLGPSALSMTTTAAPYVAWLHSTAAQAEQTAAQAKVAAAAYELAFAMTVPPLVIAANRSLLLALIATNFFGQNTPAIAATESHYAEMWTQDATAMYGYAGTSVAASQLTPFTQPPSTTNPVGLAAQSGAVAHAAGNAAGTHSTSLAQLLSTTPGVLQQLAAPTTSSPTLVDYLEHVPNVTNTILSTSNAITSGRGILITNVRLAFQATQDAGMPTAGLGERLVSGGPFPIGGSAVPGMSAGMGRAALVGPLSVPPNWAAAPEIRPVALSLPAAAAPVPPAAATGIPPVPGSAFSQSVLGTLSRDGFDTRRAKSKPVITRSPAAG